MEYRDYTFIFSVKQQGRLIAFLCLGIALTLSLTHKEELERAAELAVERAAEKAAERAAEKALESGNSTMESKIIRESHSSRSKDPGKEKKEFDDFNGRYASMDDDVEQEEDSDEWSAYPEDSEYDSRPFKDKDFRSWPSKIDPEDTSKIWRRFSRSGWSHEKSVNLEKKVPVHVTAKKKISYPIYKPYEIRIPIPPQPYTTEKSASYPMRIYVNIPDEVSQPHNIEKQTPYEVTLDKPASRKIEERISLEVKPPIPQFYHIVDKLVADKFEIPVKAPYETEKKIPVPVKISVDRPYLVPDMFKSYPVEISRPYPVEVSKLYPVKIQVPIEKPYSVPIERPIPVTVKVPKPRLYNAEKPVPMEIVKPVPVKTPLDRPYEVYETNPIIVPMRKPFPYVVQVPFTVNHDWKNRYSVKYRDDLADSESAETKSLNHESIKR